MDRRLITATALLCLAGCTGGEEYAPGRPAVLEDGAPPASPPAGAFPEAELPADAPPPDPVAAALDVALDRLAGWEPDDVLTASLALLAYTGSGETSRYGPHRKSVGGILRFLTGRVGEDGSFGTGDPTAEAAATLALSEAFGRTRSPRTAQAARRASRRLAVAPDSTDAEGGFAAFALLYRRPLGLDLTPDDLEAVRGWTRAGWAPAMESGGVALAARTLARLLLGESPRDVAPVRESLDRLLGGGVPTRDGVVADPIFLVLADAAFWRVYWWNRGDRERGERWRGIRSEAVLPLPASCDVRTAAAVACGLARDGVVCVYGGFLTTLTEDPWRRPR